MDQKRTEEDIDTMVTLALLNGAQKGIGLDAEEVRTLLTFYYEDQDLGRVRPSCDAIRPTQS